MLQPLLNFRFLSNTWVAVICCLLISSAGTVASASSSDPVQVGQVKAAVSDGSNDEMTHMSGHMHMTSLRPLKDGDQQRADTIVAAAKQAMAPYEDYRKAWLMVMRFFFRMSRNPNITLRNTSMDARRGHTSIRSNRHRCSIGKRQMVATSLWGRCTQTELKPTRTS